MNFKNAHKRIPLSMAAFAAAFLTLYCIYVPSAGEEETDALIHNVKASAEEYVIEQSNSVYTTAETANKVQNISGTEISGSAAVSFTAEVTNCSESGADDGSIKIVIENGLDGDEYYCSFNGGKAFRKMKKRTAVMDGLSEGCYSICVMKNGDRSTMSETHTVYLSSDDEIIPVEISADSRSEQIYGDGFIKVHIKDFDKEKTYEASVDGGRTWTEFGGQTAVFDELSGGEYTVVVRETGDISNDSAALNISLSGCVHGNSKKITADCILQNPELPTGCEITSLTMLLNYMGYEIDKLTMADKHLPKGEYRNSDFYEVFVGDPRDTFAYGCFSKPIVKAAESYLASEGDSDKWKVRNITGCTPDSLYAAVDRGYPVVVWASNEMKPIGTGKSWTITETGKTVTWPANEHCLLLTGYNVKKNIVCMNDPMKGTVNYKMSDFEEIFGSLGNHAVIITDS